MTGIASGKLGPAFEATTQAIEDWLIEDLCFGEPRYGTLEPDEQLALLQARNALAGLS